MKDLLATIFFVGLIAIFIWSGTHERPARDGVNRPLPTCAESVIENCK